MSNPARRVRQPGRTGKKHCDGGCFCDGACDNNGPADSVTVTLSGFSECSGLNGDYVLPNDSPAGECGCGWRFDGTVAGFTVIFQFVIAPFTLPDGTIEYVAHAALSLDGTIQYEWNATLSGGAGAVDCAGFSIALDLFADPTEPPTSCPTDTTIACSAKGSGRGKCGAAAHKNCCCGGKPKPCLHVCVIDPNCADHPIDVRVCRTSGTTYSGTFLGVSVTMTYDAAAGWTITYTCSGGGNSYTFPPGDPGWFNQGGSIGLQHDGDGWSISAGVLSQCATPNPCCSTWDGNWELDVDLTGFPPNYLDPQPCPACDQLSGYWTLEQNTLGPLNSPSLYGFMGGAILGDCGPAVPPTCGRVVPLIVLDGGLGNGFNDCAWNLAIGCGTNATLCIGQGGASHLTYTEILDPDASPDPCVRALAGWVTLGLIADDTGTPGAPATIRVRLVA